MPPFVHHHFIHVGVPANFFGWRETLLQSDAAVLAARVQLRDQ